MMRPVLEPSPPGARVGRVVGATVGGGKVVGDNEGGVTLGAEDGGSYRVGRLEGKIEGLPDGADDPVGSGEGCTDGDGLTLGGSVLAMN